MSLLKGHGIGLELVIVDDCSTDAKLQCGHGSRRRTQGKWLCSSSPAIWVKARLLRAGFEHASGDYVGIQDADAEYDPLDYLEMLKPIRDGKADVVYGSPLPAPRHEACSVLLAHLDEPFLTFVSNMFTNLDITDMETCYKSFYPGKQSAKLPSIKGRTLRFRTRGDGACRGRMNFRVYECAIHYQPRSYEEGKNRLEGRSPRPVLHSALWRAIRAPAHAASALSFIGIVCALANIGIFAILDTAGFHLLASVLITSFRHGRRAKLFALSGNFFRHKARWSAKGELGAYIVTVAAMCLLDYLCTWGFVALGLSPVFGPRPGQP